MQILVGHSKHDDVYVDFTDKAMGYLKLFKHFDECENYQFDPEYYEDEIKELQEELSDIKDASSKAMVDRRRQLEIKIKGRQNDLDEIRKEVALYEKAKKGDGEAAGKLLKMRKDHEYEGWSVHDVL